MRRAAREGESGVRAGDIKRIAVIGAGTMGHGIGQEFALAGYEVVFHDSNVKGLQTVEDRIHRNLLELVEWGLTERDQVGSTLERIETAEDVEEAGAEADLVIEAVFENLEVKQEVFRTLDAVCPEHTILASNTSSLMPSLLARVTKRPDRVLVAHYFYPPYLMPLVEIVPSESTSDQVVTAVRELLDGMGKKPIVVQKEALGFIVNRLQMALFREALNIVERGIATAQDVDTAVTTSFGRRLAVVGPLQLLEHQDGWEQALAIDQYIVPDLSNRTGPSPLVLEKIERGELGSRTGKGFYRWTAASTEAFTRRLEEALAGFLRADRERGREGRGG
jgi:3-hydroxybutyryl-CoA dehydrogenase